MRGKEENRPQPGCRSHGISHKWRPRVFAEVLGQKVPCQILKNTVQKNLVTTAYLLSGMRGTGKTSLARIFAKALNCEKFDGSGEPCSSCISCTEIENGSSLHVIEIDAASHRGIDDVRSLLETCQYSPSSRGFRIYIIDEVHMLTKEAFNALLKTLEEPPSHVIFVLATTDFHKVPSTIASRCMQLWLSAVSEEIIASKIKMLLEDYKPAISFDIEVPEIIAGLSEGSLRDSESLLEQLLAFCDKTISAETASEVLGIPQKELFLELDRAILSENLPLAMQVGDTLFSKSQNTHILLKALIKHYQDHTFAKSIKGRDIFQTIYKHRTEQFFKINNEWSVQNLTYILGKILSTIPLLEFAPHLIFRSLMLELIQAKKQVELSDVLDMIEDIKEIDNSEENRTSEISIKETIQLKDMSSEQMPDNYSSLQEASSDNFLNKSPRELARMENIINFMAKEANASISVQRKQ